MADDKLRAILQRKLGALAKPILSGFERKFKNIAKSPKVRDEIAVRLESVNGKMEVMNSIREFAIDKCEKDAELHLPDDKLHKCLQPIVGTACSIVVVQKLEEFNPELKNNDELRDKFIQLLEQTPKEDKSHMVAAVIKISKIKEILASKGDDFEFADAYKNFENITTRLLKNFYTIAKYAETIVPSNTLTEEEKIEAVGGPLFAAQTIMLNDFVEKDISSIEQAKSEINMVVGSSAGGMKYFPMLVEFVAKKSALAAEMVFGNKEFREFSKWMRDKTVQDAKYQALTGEKSPDVLPANDRGIQNGKRIKVI